jgi:predicted TIM-barrel fold metal-dependent hydrolase
MSKNSFDGEIWDCHTHVGVEQPEKDMQELVRAADRLNIDRICVLGGLTDFIRDPSPEEVRRGNEATRRAIEAFPEYGLGYVYLNPKHERQSLELLEEYVADGPMVGVKLWVAVRASDPRLDPIVERATELGAVIFQHTWLKVGGEPRRPGGGNLPGESTPSDLVELSRRHPDVQMICGHAGGDWQVGIRAIQEQEQLVLGVAGGYPSNGLVEMGVERLGPDRVVYGSDAPLRSFASQLGKVQGAGISEPAKEKILSQNLRRLMGGL